MYVPDVAGLPEPFRRGFGGVPTAYVIDRDGRIRDHFLGSWPYDELVEKVRPWLNAAGGDVASPDGAPGP